MGNYVGKHEDATSVYDGILEEILSDKIARTQKFMRTHEVRNNGQAVLKDKRKCYRSRKIRYFDRDLDDRFHNNGKSMYMTIQKYRDDTDESISRDELLPDVEHYVGKTTLQKQIDRKYAELQAFKADFCREHDCHPTEDYAVTNQCGFIVFYPAKYFHLKSELEDLEAEQKRRFRNKLDMGNEVMRKYFVERW